MALGVKVTAEGKEEPALAEAESIEVWEQMGEMTTYCIRYSFDIEEKDFPLLGDSKIDVGAELGVVVPIEGKDNYLVKGPVTSHEIHFEHGGAGSWLEVHGADSFAKMNRENKAAIWTDLKDSDAASNIVSQYGMQADVETTAAGHFEKKHTLVQRDTDYRFLRRLAHRNGFGLWIEYDESGAETVRFKTPQVDADPTGELKISMEENDIGSFDLKMDGEAPTSLSAAEVNLNDKTSIAGDVAKSPLPLLGAEAASAVGAQPRSMHLHAPVDDQGDLQARGQGALIHAGWWLRGSCQTSLNSLRKLARAHQVWKVRGLGTVHSGKYFVTAVDHVIDTSGHQMKIELARNARRS